MGRHTLSQPVTHQGQRVDAVDIREGGPRVKDVKVLARHSEVLKGLGQADATVISENVITAIAEIVAAAIDRPVSFVDEMGQDDMIAVLNAAVASGFLSLGPTPPK
jgi:succinyl-CoA synthetase alpha subunit